MLSIPNIEIGIGKLIRGWDEGVLKMKYADYGYGKKGAKGRGKSKDIPPNQDLQFKFTVTLMGMMRDLKVLSIPKVEVKLR